MCALLLSVYANGCYFVGVSILTSVILLCIFFAECHSAECHSAECRGTSVQGLESFVPFSALTFNQFVKYLSSGIRRSLLASKKKL